MILNSEIKPNDIITLKMIGGDEVVAKCVENGGNSITVKRPLIIMMNQQGFGLMPYAFTIDPDQTISISKSHVIFVSKTLKEVASSYIQQTTGLKI